VAERIAEAMQRLDHDISMAHEIVSRHTAMPAETLLSIYNRSPSPVVVSPSQALEWGIVHEIVDLNPAGISQPGVAIWTV